MRFQRRREVNLRSHTSWPHAWFICCFNTLAISHRGRGSPPYQPFQFISCVEILDHLPEEHKAVPHGQGALTSPWLCCFPIGSSWTGNFSYASSQSAGWVSSFRLGCRKPYTLKMKECSKRFLFPSQAWLNAEFSFNKTFLCCCLPMCCAARRSSLAFRLSLSSK